MVAAYLQNAMPNAKNSHPGTIRELVGLFLKLGCIGFGGPAATIAMMDDEVVSRRRWLSREHFLDLVGATNLIPGPNSTEMAMHVGYERCGFAGLAAAGFSFILPAALITGVMGWLYAEYGALPEVEPFLLGIKPAVIAIILAALWRLGNTALKSTTLVPIGVGVAGALVLGVDEIIALLGGGLLGIVWLRALELRAAHAHVGLIGLAAFGAATMQSSGQEVSLWKLSLFFLKVGCVLYGSGYVLIAFLEGDLVETYGWLTRQQLLDAVAIGQVTPGPVLTTATFIGVFLAGLPGGALATLAIFLPSFVFVAILNPLIPKLRRSPVMASFLDAINVSALALMLVVTVRLGVAVLTSWPPWVIFASAAVLVFRYRINAATIVVGGAVLGYALGLLK